MIGRQFKTSAHNIKIEITVIIGVKKKHPHILAGMVVFPEAAGVRRKFPACLLHKEHAGVSRCAADVKIIKPVLINIAYRNARSVLA